MSTRDILLAFLFTIFGVWVYEFFSTGAILLCLISIFAIYFLTKQKLTTLAVLIGIVLGATSLWVCENVPNRVLFNTPNIGEKISGIAEIKSAKQSLFGIQYVAEIEINGESTRVILETTDAKALSIGDTANFSGTLTEPEDFVGEYGKTFHYKNYLRAKGILFVIKNAKLSDVQQHSGFSILKILENIKNSFEENLEQVLHEPAVSLVEGTILGDKGAMTKADTENFRKSGLIHMIVLSGYNISIVIAFILAVLRPFPRKISLISAVIAVALFVLMSGASTTAIRAGVMGSLVIAGNFVHRKLDVLRLLSITGILMTIFSPLSALYDPSFQLSFLATFGLISFGPWAQRKLGFITEKYGLREIASATIGSQIMTLPFLAYSMGAVSVVSFFSNILVLPLAPLLMLFGFLTGLLSFMPIIYIPFAFITHIISSYIFKISEFFASLPFSMLATPLASSIIIFSLYIFLIIYGFKIYQEDKLRSLST